ncbi:MAG: glycosyltransferase family 2 protein, partial [Pseudomonadota bacterium]
PRSAYLARGWPEDTVKVPVLNGAAFFVRKAAFDSVGGFDERIFLYHEDDDLSLRLAQGVGDLMFVRTAEVTHQAGHSTVRSPETAALKAYHMGRSRVYATRKHEQPFAGTQAVLSALLQAINPVNLLSARKRSKQIAFLKGVLSAIREGAAS